MNEPEKLHRYRFELKSAPILKRFVDDELRGLEPEKSPVRDIKWGYSRSKNTYFTEFTCTEATAKEIAKSLYNQGKKHRKFFENQLPERPREEDHAEALYRLRRKTFEEFLRRGDFDAKTEAELLRRFDLSPSTQIRYTPITQWEIRFESADHDICVDIVGDLIIRRYEEEPEAPASGTPTTSGTSDLEL